jgi:hypothetical protein
MREGTMSKVSINGKSGFMAVHQGQDNVGVFCERVTGKIKGGKEYDSAQICTHFRIKEDTWKKKTRKLSAPERKIGNTFYSCQFPVGMLPEVIRSLNELYRDITGESIREADITVSEEFDETGELMNKTGMFKKDRGR